jgi:hypothetical protein
MIEKVILISNKNEIPKKEVVILYKSLEEINA